jgi:trimeric autotransporter adhesin
LIFITMFTMKRKKRLSKKLMAFISSIAIIGSTSAQIKVFPGGNTIVGSTNTPAAGIKLQVVGASLFSTATGTVVPTSAAYIRSVNAFSIESTPDYTWSGDLGTGLFHPALSSLGFSANGAERMRIHTNGCVGIGTATPLEFFQLGDRFTFHNGGTKYLGFNSYYDGVSGSNKRLVADYAATIAFGGGDISFSTAGTSAAGSAISFANVLQIKNGGNIGINNVAPNYKLDVGGGDINIGSLSNGYRINGALVLTQKNIFSSIFVGNGAGNATTAANSTALGYKAMFSTTTGVSNSAMGAYALYSNVTGAFNTALGDSTLYNFTGASNTAVGASALFKNMTGVNNTAVGVRAGYSNTTGVSNCSFGYLALNKNLIGGYNCAFGQQALHNTTSHNNSAFGGYALLANTSGTGNTALGYQAVNKSTTAVNNTGVGILVLQNTTTGGSNTAVGNAAGTTNITGSGNTYVGSGADANGNNYTNASSIGNGAIVLASNRVRIGDATITQIGGQVGWTTLSDARFKTDIKENVRGLEFIKKLRPVTYKVSTEKLDDYLIKNMPDSVQKKHKEGMDYAASSKIVYSGFIAQEVEKVSKQLGYENTIVSKPANDNDIYGISYAELVVPLVKAMQEQAVQVDSLKEATQKLEATNRELQQQLTDIVKNCCQQNTRTQESGINGTYNQENSASNWLAQNKPNPFNKETVIEYNVVQQGKGSILIFDMNGKLLKTIAVKIPGKGSVTISANDFVAGMYYYSLVVNDVEVDTKKMILTQ